MPAIASPVAAGRPGAVKPAPSKGFEEPTSARPGSLLPEREAAEVERRTAAFYEEIRPSGELGQTLIRLAATMSVRMERCVAHEAASLTERVRRAIADFVPPAGADAAEVARLRAEAGTRAAFDPSPEGAQARRYEAAASRSFFRALKELRLIEREARAAKEEQDGRFLEEVLGSSCAGERIDADLDAIEHRLDASRVRDVAGAGVLGELGGLGRRVDVPLTIGRRR